jgi:hypothetical protein
MDGKTWEWIHGGFVVIFVIIWVMAMPWFFGWISSVEFISHMSMTALVYAAASAWQAARAEKKVDENGS